jgi:hypothetical protein
MIQRYSLYGTPEQWAGNIQADAGGRWVRWADIVPYLEYCEQQGFQPPEQLELPEVGVTIDMMVGEMDNTIVTNDDDHELPLDGGEDLYELITHENHRVHTNTTDSD